MNNSGLIIAGSFLAGVGVGFLIGKQMYEAKYAQLAQEEIDSAQEFFRHKYETEQEEALAEAETISEPYCPPENSFRTVPSHLVRSSLDNNKSELAKKDYQLYKPTTSPLQFQYPTTKSKQVEDEEAEEEETPKDPEKPYLIEDTQYSEECDHYSKIALIYYQDGVLMTEDEAMIDDIAHTIGHEAFAMLTTGIRGPLWVRNENIEVDYEIIVMTQPFGEMMDTPSNGSMRRRTPHEDDDET